MNQFRRALAVLCLAMAMGVVPAVPAGAATTVGDSDTSAAAAPPTYCHDPTFGGTYICAYGRRFFNNPNGAREIFVIGTNYSVYTRWQRPDKSLGPWVNLGGQILHSYSESDLYLRWCPSEYELELYVRGTDAKLYSNVRIRSGAWLGWELGTRICFT